MTDLKDSIVLEVAHPTTGETRYILLDTSSCAAVLSTYNALTPAQKRAGLSSSFPLGPAGYKAQVDNTCSVTPGSNPPAPVNVTPVWGFGVLAKQQLINTPVTPPPSTTPATIRQIRSRHEVYGSAPNYCLVINVVLDNAPTGNDQLEWKINTDPFSLWPDDWFKSSYQDAFSFLQTWREDERPANSEYQFLVRPVGNPANAIGPLTISYGGGAAQNHDWITHYQA